MVNYTKIRIGLSKKVSTHAININSKKNHVIKEVDTGNRKIKLSKKMFTLSSFLLKSIMGTQKLNISFKREESI